MIPLWLLACADPPPGRGRGDPPGPDGTLVLAGGGAEGELGDEEAWSARAYAALLDGGDVTGDGEVRVAVVSVLDETEWLPDYLRSLGADDAVNLRLRDRGDAETEDLDGFDAVFVKGGDQGAYYDAWRDTAFARAVVALHRRGGGVGGTSAGAMSMAGVALAGGQDLVSADVLEDACTRWLDDASDGGSGLHDDFLGLVPGVVVDTHVTVRGRLGRMVGALARAVDDGLPARGILGIDERTALVVHDGVGTVVGAGAVKWVRPGPSAPVRRCGAPLRWTDLALDALVDGWALDLATGEVLPGPGARDAPPAPPADNAPGAWSVDGGRPADEERFGWVVTRGRDPYDTRPGRAGLVQRDAIGVLDAHDTERRGPAEEALLAALADHPGATGFVLGDGGGLARDGADRVRATGRLAALVVDAGAPTARDTSPEPATVDPGLRAAGLAGLRLHVLADGAGYDTRTHAPLDP